MKLIINGLYPKSWLNFLNFKMDSFSDSGPEEAHSISGNCKKAEHSVNSCPYGGLKSNGDIGIEVASKYIGKLPGSYNPKGLVKSVSYSSDDDSDSEFSSMSLVALAAKHKNKNPLHNAEAKTVLGTSTIHSQTMPLKKSSLLDSCDSSSDSEGSLFALMKKHKTCLVDGYKDTEAGKQQTSNVPKLDKLSVNDSIDFNHRKVDLDNEMCNLRVQDIATKFVAASFSDDTDSDEPMSLVGLALKQSAIANRETYGSTDDVRSPNPSVKEIQSLVNYHRQHTKSESDRFSSGAPHPSDSLLRENQVNNMSTSLRSLRGGGCKDLGFQFSPGSSVPGSFKSLNASNSLNSSLVSVGVERAAKGPGSYTDITNTYSDSDISIGSRHFDNQFYGSDVKNISQFNIEKNRKQTPAYMVDGGINLSCALKKSVSARTSESLMSEDSVEIPDDAEDEEIVTLLDTMMVDEVDDDEKAKKRLLSNSELDESCTIDVSNILKVRLKLRTRKCSSFGKVVCRQWKSLAIPCIRKDKFQTKVVPFQFSEPSPDDVLANIFKMRL